tara:strand:+ start:414 stop:620 length:207 start_codon:yes stop_codon:yes gene_type:complete
MNLEDKIVIIAGIAALVAGASLSVKFPGCNYQKNNRYTECIQRHESVYGKNMPLEVKNQVLKTCAPYQ